MLPRLHLNKEEDKNKNTRIPMLKLSANRPWQTREQEHKSIYFPIPTTTIPALCLLSSHITGSYSVVIIALQYMSESGLPGPYKIQQGLLKTETPGSLASLSFPGRYPDRKQLDGLWTELWKHFSWKGKAVASDSMENIMDFSPGVHSRIEQTEKSQIKFVNVFFSELEIIITILLL